jgi:hypothetical protein
MSKALQAYVDRHNNFYAVLGYSIKFDLQNAEDRQRIADKIDSALSPENLTCDGELSRSQVQARYRELTTVAKQLQKLDPNVKFYEFG